MLRLLAAALLGGAVGLERERLEWAAGLRTHMLVCLGAALAVIVSAHGFDDGLSPGRVVLDPSRVAAQVISGIGFLGAGTILLLRQEVIRGLTTAASLWTVAAVGLAAGCGLYIAAITATALIVVVLALIKPLERRIFRRDLHRRVTVSIDREAASLLAIERELETSGLNVRELTLRRGDDPEEDRVEFTLHRGAPKDALLAVVEKLRGIEGVRGITL